MEIEFELTASYFDGSYADMVGSVAKDAIQHRQLGLPAPLLSTSLLSSKGIAEVVEALGLSRGETLLDLACGRGGYGLDIATRTGATLVGVDFSAEAVRQAREHAQRLDRIADFHIADMAATGLAPAQLTRSCASMPSSLPNRQTRRTARCGESSPRAADPC